MEVKNLAEIIENSPSLDENKGAIHQISVNKIVPNPYQPRKAFGEDGIIKLADSIRQYGIIQPITVRKCGEMYEIVSGERRFRAAKELNLSQVPCIIVSIDEEKSAEISIIENIIREDLNIFEQAMAIETLIDTYDLTQEQVAQKLSNSQSFVANKLRLLRLTMEEREIILSNKLSERHARAVLRIYDADERKKLLQKIASEGLTVASTEEIVDKILSKDQPKKKKDLTTYKSVSSFYCAILRALDTARNSNLSVKSRKIVGDSFTELTILIPNQEGIVLEDEYEEVTDRQ